MDSETQYSGWLRQIAGTLNTDIGFFVVIKGDAEFESFSEGPWSTAEEAQAFIDAEVGTTNVEIVYTAPDGKQFTQCPCCDLFTEPYKTLNTYEH